METNEPRWVLKQRRSKKRKRFYVWDKVYKQAMCNNMLRKEAKNVLLWIEHAVKFGVKAASHARKVPRH
jgi:hypothetical protein